MIVDSPSFSNLHPNIAYWVDTGTKLGALGLGGIWTYWNYRRSRTYAQKLDLQITGDVFFRQKELFLDAAIVLRNVGASVHFVQPEGTTCDIIAIMSDLREIPLRLFPVFELHSQIEPGESISDHIVWKIEALSANIIWIRINLRVVSGKVEWMTTSMVRVEETAAEK